MARTTDVLEKRLLRNVLFFAARRLLGGLDGPHDGALRVTVADGVRAEVLTCRPRTPDEGRLLALPRPELLFDADDGLVPTLLACFLSPDERGIVRALAAREVKGEVLMKRLGLNRSRFYTLVANLKERGLLADGENGYRVREPRLLEVLGEAGEG